MAHGVAMSALTQLSRRCGSRGCLGPQSELVIISEAQLEGSTAIHPLLLTVQLDIGSHPEATAASSGFVVQGGDHVTFT